MDIHVLLCVALTLLPTQVENCLEEQQCSNCSSTTEFCLTDCYSGYFDRKCKSQCNKNCKNSTCKETGRGIPECTDGCVPGFRGTQCDLECTSPNLKCTRCPQGCDGTFCHFTSPCVSGCHGSYYGSNCKTCSRRCRYCNGITGRCDVCHDPYSGGNCQFSCEHCSTPDAVQTCAPGLYGHTCSKPCSKNCLAYPTADANNTVTDNSSNSFTSECHRYSGECINGCADGWSGPNCSSKIQCNSNCMGCNETGACVEGCLPGYYGDDCKPCSGTCFNHTCNQNNGSCDNGCIHGQYGQFCKRSCSDCPGNACHPSTGICAEETKGSTTTVLVIGLATACVLSIVGILVFLFRRCRKSPSTERDHQGDGSISTERSRQVETLEYYTLHQYWDIEDYDEVSQPLDQQQGPAEEDNISDPALPVLVDNYPGALHTEDNTSDPVLPTLADYFPGTLDTEDNNIDPVLPVLADYFPGTLGTEDNNTDPVLPVLADYFPGTLDTEDNNSDPVLPVLADYFPGARDTEDNGGDTSCSSSSGSHSYTHLVRNVIVEDPITMVTYISPTEDKI